VFIEAAREIAAGEEITFNYGYDLEDCRDYPCRCGAPSCVGYIVAEEFFPQVRRLKALAAEAGGSGTRPQQERPGGL
jgi:SET domain-containing protein